MDLKKIHKKILKTYMKVLKASAKRNYRKAEDLDWKLLQLQLKLSTLEKKDD